MNIIVKEIQQELRTILQEYQEQAELQPGQVFVVGCSTSEVMGKRIGTSGTDEVAEKIYGELQAFADDFNLQLAFQCCEHLNRALVVERTSLETYGWDEVSVVPVKEAGGAMATYAFHRFHDPAVVEHIVAHGGIDIGDTFIGMHIKHVAVPVRVTNNSLGSAHVTLARSRPKLIGGARAVYERQFGTDSCR
ncbi:hypothetical protein Q75_16405 [Bacillus coahuilensis p1.1.43]|uniref:UPF0340 protein Q75_16405 n=1 Tax=Bacillus coahuilensis p1.1.43 TaxID=1150625 RepID=A0A147K4B8_9BACI|nr:TIGR01440 family protein [Bacillus coahuilensis]KUP04165.1 hypothetical protein Q75_16405 [Bacillus coahuilensis p1.1.43]